MNYPRENLYARPLGQLPNNDALLILSNVGEVTYSSSPSEPTWTCLFKVFHSEQNTGVTRFPIKLGGSIIQAASVGSLWKARKNVGFAGSAWPNLLYSNLPDCPSKQKVVYRINISDDFDPAKETEFRSNWSQGARPYLVVPLLGEASADFALISCFEIYRYYYGCLPSVSRHFFSFDIDGNNPKLFRPANTKPTDAFKTYQIDPLPSLSDADQRRIAHYLSSKSARKAIGLTAASARASSVRNVPVLPVCRIPICGINKWAVSARLRKLNIEIDGELRNRPVLAISRIIECFDDLKIQHVLSTRQRIIRLKDADINVRNLNKGAGAIPLTISSDDIPVVSDEPPGSVIRVASPALEEDEFDRECWEGVSFKRIGSEKEIAQVYFPDPSSESIMAASTQLESGGLLNIGRLQDDPSRNGRSKQVPVDENLYRSHLPHIFDVRVPGRITANSITTDELPITLRYLFDSAKAYMDADGSRRGCFVGGDSNDFYPDSLSIYTLNPAWGKNTICRASPDNVRRAIVFAIPVNNGTVYFFDLEKKKSEKIGIHVMLFNGQFLTTNQISSILYCRLEGATRGWPDRTQFSGEFWSNKLYHYDQISDDTKGLLIGRCVQKISYMRSGTFL